GQFWDDIKRWKAGPEFYPCNVIGGLGELIEVKFPNGYNLSRDNLIPIADGQIAMNPNLIQNPGY
ncbi:MAG: RagB/SusD family nutrient uptake outer membrane protein, partial [Tannerella sp.]|nr:RagB/SusD family nutrient uptake outer membrane protein [Tannerella sp.]